ncbi:MAG: hypothetical protein ACI97K_001773 [Glaciecola sp.]|jgi:hypothetical protein
MSLVRPNAVITLDGQKLTSAEAGLVSLRLDLGFNTHDKLQMTLWPNSKLGSASPGSELVVELNNEVPANDLLSSIGNLLGDENPNALWTGTVDSVQRSAGQLFLSGLASSAQLSQARLSATWADQSIADIIKDMAGDIDTEIEADLNLANYSIDNSRSVWSYLYDLAQLTGAELSSAANGGVRFVLAAKDSSSISLRYGADLIDWNLSEKQSSSLIVAAQHGASSSAGKEKWHWLAHDPVGSDGDSTVIPAAFSNREAADAFSDAALSRQQRSTIQGEVWIGGRTDLRPGTLVELTGLPQGDSGKLRVKAVTHQMDGKTGFITALAVEGYSESSSFGF